MFRHFIAAVETAAFFVATSAAVLGFGIMANYLASSLMQTATLIIQRVFS